MIDPSCKLHMTPEEMAKQMGVSLATVRNKANIIRKAVEVDSHDAFRLANDLLAFEAMDAFTDHLTPLPIWDGKKRKH
jgi:hypothetical protein